MLVLGVIALIGAGAILTFQAYTRRKVVRALDQALPISAEFSANAVHEWIAARRAETSLSAQLVAAEAASRGDLARAAKAPLQVVVATGAFSSGAVFDQGGARVASVNPRSSGDGTGDTAVLEPFASLGPATETVEVQSQFGPDSAPLLAFTAPIVRNGERLGRVVLRTSAGPSAFPYLNPTGPMDRSQRTTLLAADADAVILLTTLGPAESPAAVKRIRMRRDDLPAWIGASLAGKTQHGVGQGLGGTQVIFASEPVAGAPWVLVRERDMRALNALLTKPLLINDAIFVVILLLVIGVVVALWRTAYLRRENESSRLRSNFVASMSHELRAPLTQIRMYAEMLRGGLLREPGESERALGVIEKESERLALLVDRTLDFARSRRATPGVSSTVADVASAVQSATAAYAPLAAERHVHLVVAVPDGTRARIETDALQQIVVNLLDNSVKYGPRGQTVRIGAQASGAVTRLWVHDEGPGIPPAEREGIWAPYERGRAAKASGEAGSGIGLSVVRDVAAQYGGRAYLETSVVDTTPGQAPSRGARFVIELASGLEPESPDVAAQADVRQSG